MRHCRKLASPARSAKNRFYVSAFADFESTFENAAFVRGRVPVYPQVFFENSKLNETRYFSVLFKVPFFDSFVPFWKR